MHRPIRTSHPETPAGRGQRIDGTLQTDGFFERLWRRLIKEQRYAEYFAHAAELERPATSIRDWAPAVVPGLLRKPAYARAIRGAGNPLAADEYIEETARR